MSQLRHLFTGRTPGIRVRVYESDAQDQAYSSGRRTFYMACGVCGNCSEVLASEQDVCQLALDHVESHESQGR